MINKCFSSCEHWKHVNFQMLSIMQRVLEPPESPFLGALKSDSRACAIPPRDEEKGKILLKNLQSSMVKLSLMHSNFY